jgi:hypothetical protein
LPPRPEFQPILAPSILPSFISTTAVEKSTVTGPSPPTVSVASVWVNVTSPATQFITDPVPRNKSLHAVPLTPSASASSEPGKTLFPAGSSVIFPTAVCISNAASLVISSALITF